MDNTTNDPLTNFITFADRVYRALGEARDGILRDMEEDLDNGPESTMSLNTTDTWAEFFRSFAEAMSSEPQNSAQESIAQEITPQESIAQEITPQVPSADTGEMVEYTYQPGDTFGQVLTDTGLSDGSNLWGEDGDVAYYTQQLRDSGALNSFGNIPIGTTIRLRKRNSTDEPAKRDRYRLEQA